MVSASVFLSARPVQLMDATFSQLPKVLHPAAGSAQGGLWGLQLSQQPDKEQDAPLHFLQVP